MRSWFWLKCYFMTTQWLYKDICKESIGKNSSVQISWTWFMDNLKYSLFSIECLFWIISKASFVPPRPAKNEPPWWVFLFNSQNLDQFLSWKKKKFIWHFSWIGSFKNVTKKLLVPTPARNLSSALKLKYDFMLNSFFVNYFSNQLSNFLTIICNSSSWSFWYICTSIDFCLQFI